MMASRQLSHMIDNLIVKILTNYLISICFIDHFSVQTVLNLYCVVHQNSYLEII